MPYNDDRWSMNSETIRLLIADSTGSVADPILSFLKGDRTYEVVGRATTGDECLNMTLIKHPHLVIIHSELKNMSAIEACEQLAQQDSDVGVLMVLSAGFDEDLFQRMMGAGVAGFIFCPLEMNRTMDAIRSALMTKKKERQSLSAAPGAQEDDKRRVIAVIGSRGGSGRTTVAVNLSCAIAKATATRRDTSPVVLVDANVPGGDAAMFLDMNPRRTLLDISPKATVIDHVMVESLLENHPSGVSLLMAAGSETGDRPELPRGTLLHVLTHLRRQFPFTVVDMAETMTEASRAVLDFCDDVLLVVGADLPRLEAARLFMARLLESNFSRGKIHVVLNNKEPYSSNISTAEAEKILECRVAARLPYDKHTVPSAINLGQPFVLRQPDKPVSRAIHDLAHSLGAWEQHKESGLAALFKTISSFKKLPGAPARATSSFL